MLRWVSEIFLGTNDTDVTVASVGVRCFLGTDFTDDTVASVRKLRRDVAATREINQKLCLKIYRKFYNYASVRKLRRCR